MFYEGQELAARIRDLAEEACRLPSGIREDHYLAYTEALRRAPGLAPWIIKLTPPEFFDAPDAPELIRSVPKAASAAALFQEAQVRHKAGQFQEAEKLYQKLLEADPKNVGGWLALGLLLARDCKRFTEAEQAYRRAIELEPKECRFWINLANVLEKLGRPEEAEQAWASALEIAPSFWVPALALLRFRLKRGEAPNTILQAAAKVIEQAGRQADVLTASAGLLLQEGFTEGLEQAEAWAREAYLKCPSWQVAATLLLILAAQSKWEEALEASRPVLDAAATEERAQRSATALLIEAAAAGHGRAALEKLLASGGAAALEPLAVGLRIYAGETPRVAKEILEIGQDVAERIGKRKNL